MAEIPTHDKAQHLRYLLPAAIKESQPPRPPLPTVTAKSNPVAAACNTCRKIKVKCSGERPACRRCVTRRIACHYVTQPGETPPQAFKRRYHHLKHRSAAHEELIGLLKNLPRQEAQNVFERIRSGTDILTILNHVKVGNVLLQMAVSPETRLRYELPYLPEIPEEFVPNNPYLDSMVYEATSLYETHSRGTSSSLITNLGSEYQNLYLMPFHSARVCDAQLSIVKPSLWTTVCDDDALMRDLLEAFLRCEYHFTAAFQKDYFLQDMAAQRQDFCSSLLVNIVLGYSCVCYPGFQNRAEYWNPHTLLYRFVAEAKRLWELEATEPRLTTIQAGIIFNVFHNLCGLDEIGQSYRVHAIALAHNLHLFHSSVKEQSERTRNGRAFTAWALYNWETLVGFSFMFSPLLKEPPDWPLPNPSEDAQWYGEIWVNYPPNHSLTPSYFGQVLNARSQFRVIMNEFCQEAYAKGSEMSLPKANKILSRLTAWFNGLPAQLQPKTIVLPGHLQLHMYFYYLVLAIYEPLLDTKANQEASPQRIIAEAKRYLQTLIRLYYLRHGFDAMDLFIVIPLMLAGSECIEAINERTSAPQLKTLRSTLILVAKGLYSQRRNHYLSEALFRVIRGRMRQQEVALLKDTVDLEDEAAEEKRDKMQTVRSHWPVSIVKKKEDLDSQILKNLVENYAHLNTEDKSMDAQEFQV
ncbi:hypothetical protein QQS21_011536 [Conoideocrella luteorostrata]|uniref:Zn(2)-C6 fungal-type domain-containing protein n=1 Tax=Conoideocrella luteorostrata TaxID=1105319 RepID=A0AAJ0CFP0_9HYPO|nr:hypothetical protein QQS21_011536 [Conoideocrella luteorostrata]